MKHAAAPSPSFIPRFLSVLLLAFAAVPEGRIVVTAHSAGSRAFLETTATADAITRLTLTLR